jgi:hypothetical protein
MKIGAILFARNEEHIIEEWVAHHLGLGIERIHVFDHMSTDSTREKLEVIHKRVPGVTVQDYTEESDAQTKSYNLGLALMAAEDIDWCAFIDTDEFIVPGSSSTFSSLADMLISHSDHCAIALHWAFFGSSDHVDRPSGLMQESFLRRADETFQANRLVKSIVRPKHTKRAFHSHGFEVNGDYYTANGQIVEWNPTLPFRAMTNPLDMAGWRINHYFCQWKGRWTAKVARSKMRGKDGTVRSDADWHHHDRNEVFDPSALAWTQRDAEILGQITSSHHSV